MRTAIRILVLVLASSSWALATDSAMLQERRQRAAAAFPDGILLLQANSNFDRAIQRGKFSLRGVLV
jgi:hypothetical protein